MTEERCIIIPAYNEEGNIGGVIRNIDAYTDAPIVVIDDGSRDMTAQKAREAGATAHNPPLQPGVRGGASDRL